MSQFRFAQLHWLHAIWIVVVFAALLVLLELRGRSLLDRMLSRLMQARLVSRPSLARRISAIVLTTLSLVALVAAMMRPQWGMTVQQITRVDSQVMVCLDVSKSMLAEDVAPNRLDRAKAELDSLLTLMEEGQQVGLIAFAGKATVLCPMTTDFGFLRLVLQDARPSTVGLGGTKIGEAIRKAVEGFGQAGDVNRLILLITDGEDHESFPLDAAGAAKERGIRIVSVGFGDEAGSKIEVTDPRTGVRSFVKDASGNDVVSRLDGESLREIALDTSGAYIPAGTGALDLESIYETHIVSMLQGTAADQQRIVRHEAYQWCVVAALILLVLGLLAASPWSLRSQALAANQDPVARGPARAASIIAIICVLTTQVGAQEEPTTAGNTVAAGATAAEQEQPEQAPDDANVDNIDDIDDEDRVTPRAAYNDALAYVRSDPDRAERLLNQARRQAGIDGEVRFRALYNLGWVEVNRADAVLEENPQDALTHLQEAAHRFREAIRVRPDNTDARHNLEIISRRILELADALANKDPRDLETQLDELIQQLRSAQAELASLVQRVAETASVGRDEYRVPFRRAGITQRQTIADTQKFAAEARRQLDSLEQKKDQELAPQERLRLVQLNNMLQYVESSLQRMEKARGLTRRIQGSRAFTRWSSALTAAKRARDQLRNPVEVLGVIVEDARQLAESTRAKALSTSVLGDDQQDVRVPAWLTGEYLQETQNSTTERTQELANMLAAAVQGSRAEPDEATSKAAGDRETKQLLTNIQESLPFLKEATEAFRQASVELEADRFEPGFAKQTEAIIALRNAAELFFDVRRLIELLYGEQQLIRTAMESAKQQPGLLAQMTDAISQTLSKNLQRCQRLDSMFDAELAQIEEAPAPESTGPNPPAAQTPDLEKQRFEQAKQLLTGVTEDVQQICDSLEETSAEDSVPSIAGTEPPGDAVVERPSQESEDVQEPEVDEDASVDQAEQRVTASEEDDQRSEEAAVDPVIFAATSHADASLEKIELLRRLFFSLVEHLRDTAQRQSDLNDDTNEIAGKTEWQTPEKIGPLLGRQRQLQAVADQISQALKQQAQQATAQAETPQQGPATASPGQADPQQAAELLSQAGDLVREAESAMGTAAEGLNSAASADEEQVDFAALGGHQQTSLQKLVEALTLLDDRQQQPQQNQGDQQDQEQQENEQPQEQQQQNLNTNQLLQLIRDREAQRRKDRERGAETATGSVDKDW